MATPPFASSLFRRAPRRERERPDPADMGTAFGLEATFEPVTPETIDATPARAPRAAVPVWWRRFMRRD